MAITDVRVARWAKTLAEYCLDIQPGDIVSIASTPLAEPLITAFYRETLKHGGYPVPLISLPSLNEILLNDGSDEQLLWRSPIEAAVSANANKRLRISASANPLALTNISSERMALANRPPQINPNAAKSPRALTWCGTLWPTEGAAQLAGMSLAEFEEFVFEACFLNSDDPAERWKELGRQQQKYVDWLKGKKAVEIHGTGVNLSLSIAGRTFINSDGKRNFPSGEFFTGPVEDSVNGSITFDFPSSRDGKIVRGASLVFEKGKVINASAAEGEDFLLKMLNIDEGARYLGEFAFGNNFGIDRAIINTLYDEKIGGTIHMALGESYPETGGLNHSAIHWDFIKEMRADGEVYIDGELFMKNGRFLF